MLPEGVHQVLHAYPDLAGLVRLLGELSEQSDAALEQELKEHVAARVFFLLLGEVASAPNYDLLETRLDRKLRLPRHQLAPIAEAVARALASLHAGSPTRKASLRDLPYPTRRQLLSRQGQRCGICGWLFSPPSATREPQHGSPTLDHRIPAKFGGERLENLWIACGLCNAIKGSTIHIGEHGRTWIGNHAYFDNRKVVAFWTLVRDRQCRVCGRTPTTVRLFVARAHKQGPYTVDNCVTQCEEHVDARDAIEY